MGEENFEEMERKYKILKEAAEKIDTEIENLPRSLMKFKESLEEGGERIENLKKKLESS